MLYERWRQVVRDRPAERALRDLASGRCWTFAALEAEAGKRERRANPMTHPAGGGADFILQVLAGWRHQQVVCPLEPGQVPPATAPPPQPCAHLKTTSATTGSPRLVRFTAAQLAADADHIVSTMGLRPEWPNLGVISLAHSYGFSNLVLPLLLHGIPLVLGSSALPEALRQVLGAEPALTLPAVPALWRAWHEAQVLPGNLRLAVSAGAPLPPTLERDVFEVSGLKIHNFYGSTECGGIAYDRSDRPRSEDTLAGTAMDGVTLSLTGDGCVVVQSAAVGQGYWPVDEARLRPGRFETADLGDLTAGQVRLLGRASDQINVAGRKVLPGVIEHLLASHPGVRDCLIFGVPAAAVERMESIVACLSLAPGTALDTVRAFAVERLPAWQVPREWWQVDAIATDARGKVNRLEWRRRYLETRRGSETVGMGFEV